MTGTLVALIALAVGEIGLDGVALAAQPPAAPVAIVVAHLQTAGGNSL